jgi:type 1 glutamine amidotransferase
VLAFALTWIVLSQVAPAPAGPAGQATPPAPAAGVTSAVPPRVVLVSGEDEYDSEATLTALAHLLAERHGMTTLLAASHSPASVNGLDSLADADLAILFVRSRTWPEAQWRRLDDFLARGGGLVALRSSVAAFAYPAGSPRAAENEAFGTRLFGTLWPWDHGRSSSTDVVITPRRRYADDHDLLRGVVPSFHVRSWLVHVQPLPEDVNVIARGTPVDSEHDRPEVRDSNPVAWTRNRPDGGRTFYTSLGHPDDFEVADFRRLVVNGIYWTLRRSTGAMRPPKRGSPPVPEDAKAPLPQDRPEDHGAPARSDPKAPADPNSKAAPGPKGVLPNGELDVAWPVTKPLNAFEISTPYVSDWTKPIASQHFPPEEGIAGFNDVRWIPLPSPDGSIDFRRFDPNSKQGVIYARTVIQVDSPRELELVIQSDDGVELFVDGKSRFTSQEVRSLLAGCDCVPLQLAAGEHPLMFKVMNAGGAWQLKVRVRDLTEYRERAVKKK